MVSKFPASALVAGLLIALLALAHPASPARAQDAATKDLPPLTEPAQERPVLVEPSKPLGAQKAVASIPAATGGTSRVAASSTGKGAVDRTSVFRLVLNANPMLWPLAICSIVTLGYIMERFAALRKERVVPHEFVDRFLERLSSGKLDRERALELCRAHESATARIFAVIVSSWGQPGLMIRQIVSYDGAGEIVELKRNLRVLSAMATLGPLLGLLGTVVGIIQSFDALGGRLGPARGEALAHGISLALVATAFGLSIAIISVLFYYYFLNRVDVLMREIDDRARQVIELVSSESHRLPPLDRRHGSIGPAEASRHEARAI